MKGIPLVISVVLLGIFLSHHVVCHSLRQHLGSLPVRSPCGHRCSRSCDRLCGTPHHYRCCAGLYTKRSVAEEPSDSPLALPAETGGTTVDQLKFPTDPLKRETESVGRILDETTQEKKETSDRKSVTGRRRSQKDEMLEQFANKKLTERPSW